MTSRRTSLSVVLLMVVLPWLGLALGEKPPLRYLEFPPLTQYVDHAPFAWTVFAALAAVTALVVGPFIWRVCRSQRSVATPAPVAASRRFPRWGWLGLAFGAATWVLAWTRFEWFHALQPFTFTPLWVAYIVVVNALTQRRTGACMLRDRPGYVLKLSLLSAAFWWFFEYLNRFVQNWHYLGVASFSPAMYALFATLSFATVLPAVLGTAEWLAAFPGLTAGLDRFAPIRPRHPRAIAGVALVAAGAGLAVVALFPDYLFPLLWLAPLAVLSSVHALRGQPTAFAGIATGDWRRVVRFTLAALICGFFWEMWNDHSLAKWVYTVPFVDAFHLFEMPLLGYTGYLPFGLECAVVADAFLEQPREIASPARAPARPPAAAVRLCSVLSALVLAGLAVFFFIAPACRLVATLRDPAWRTGAVPTLAWTLHRNLSPKYAAWARDRLASGVAAHLPLHDVPSTEWPVFGSVFYLLATEQLQQEWERDPSPSVQAPAEYARDAIEAATDLVLDPVHHTWVRTHWGADYLHRENVFFRSLLIAAITAHENLLHDGRGLDLLRDQADSLASDLDASPLGLLDDYPGECYPVDDLAAIAWIRAADRVLGTDHSAFATRARRGFEGRLLDACGLPPYTVDPRTGAHYEPSRGVGNSWVMIFVPELWPDQAGEWYRRYESHFWQDKGWAAGFREFARGLPGKEFGYDVDAGPILAGFSPAANAFGLAAARVNGRMDHAFTLGMQVLAATWPLPNGGLLGPRLLSSAVHAPYLGEACLLFLMVQQPAPGVAVVRGGTIPWCVHGGLAFYALSGTALLLMAVRRARRGLRGEGGGTVPGCIAWAVAILLAVVAFGLGWTATGVLLLSLSPFVPSLRAV